MKRKNKKALDSFTKYCKKHPNQRFWQALRNWSKYDVIEGAKISHNGDFNELEKEDTFYKRGR